METSALTSPAPTIGSQFDVTNLDQSLREVAAIERSWSLPRLPDAVKLDLISQPDVNQQGLGVFLRGLDDDFNPPPEPEPFEPRVTFLDENFNRSGWDQARIIAAGVAGKPAPQDPTIDAVKHFKIKAIEKGYLDRETTIDSTWSSELNSVRSQMAFDEYNERRAGNRPGAMSMNSIMDTLGKWTSPTGLLAAATELDMWWDFGAIDNEFSSWGDKWRKLDEASNPFDFGKKLVDAVTGPLDDIIIPVANWALLASSVGVMTNTARVGWMAGRTGLGTKLVRGLYSMGDTLNVRNAANLTRLGERSWTATKLSGSSRTALQAVGGGLEAWRANSAVRSTKAVTQFGMRLGFVSQAEDALPGYQGGVDLAGAPGVREVNQRLTAAYSNPLAVIPELMFAPYNIFTPGTFFRQAGEGAGVVSRTASGLLTVAGNDLGRAALGGVAGLGLGVGFGDDMGDAFEGAAIGAGLGGALPHIGTVLGSRVGVPLGRSVAGAAAGAGLAYVLDDDDLTPLQGAGLGMTLMGARSIWRKTALNGRGYGKYVGYGSDFLKHMSFKPINDNQRLTNVYHNAASMLPEADKAIYDKTFSETKSVLSAYKAVLGVDDDETLGAAFTFPMIAAAIDNTAGIQAGGVENLREFHMFRNKLTAQLRTFDVDGGLTPGVIREAALARAYNLAGSPQKMRREFAKALEEWTARPEDALEWIGGHNETARKTLEQLMKPENIPILPQLLTGEKATGNLDEGLAVLENYLAGVMPTFGNWPQFDAQTAHVTDLMRDGLFAGAKFKAFDGAYGKPMRFATDEMLKTNEISEGVLAAITAGDANIAKLAKKGRMSMLASPSVTGRMTVARADTVTKQQVMAVTAQISDLLDVDDAFTRLLANAVDVGGLMSKVGARPSDRQIAALLKQAGSSTSQAKNAKKVIKYLRHHGVSSADLRVHLDNAITKQLDDVDTWRKFNMDEVLYVTDEGSRVPRTPVGREALGIRRKQLVKKAKFTAAEIDLDDLAAQYADDPVKLAEVETLRDGLAGDGYKLVHGVEFLMPHDLARSAMFEDISRRNLNAVTLGNAFKGRHPLARKMDEERRIRLAMSRHLLDGAPDLSDDLSPESNTVGNILADLNQILEEFQNRSNNVIDELHEYNWFSRRIKGIESSTVPLRAEDLTRSKKAVLDRLEPKWGKEAAEAAWKATADFRNAEFKDVGLYAIEAHLRTQNQLAESLKFLGGSKYRHSSLVAAQRGAIIGGAAGLAAGYADEDGPGNDMLTGALAGVVGGAVASKVVPRIAPKAEMFRYGYLADNLVTMRDTLRFTLSPFFDLSRYTEGLMLGQTAAPLRNPQTGEKIVMPFNVTPSALRRGMAKKMIAESKGTMSKNTADRLARDRFDEIRTQFRLSAKVDYDPDVLDQVGRHFKQIGLMGFNPTDWMTTAFAHLVDQGVSSHEAYKAARGMYTYGTQGRSAAEMSVNFIFFPFSFQKKALTHLGKYLNDDLSRSIMLHDAFKTYEVLNKEFNLDERWREHLPILNQMTKFNLFAYGLSPGRFGGINAQVLESSSQAVLNLFTPQGVSVKNAAEAAELERLVRSAAPVLNDIDYMLKQLGEQGHVLMSPTHQTTKADITDGYAEWNKYKSEVSQTLEAQGFTWRDLSTKQYLAPMKAAYDLKRAELAAKYPAWRELRVNATERRVSEQIEREDRLARAENDPENASIEDIQMAQFENELTLLKENLSYQGVDVGGQEGWSDIPPEVAQYITGLGVQMLKQNPRWMQIWDRYYRADFGVLEADV